MTRRKTASPDTTTLLDIYDRLLDRYGPQGWWPADSAFEVMVGTILVQATSWINAERAINALKSSDLLSPDAIRRASESHLADTIRPGGYHNSKARKLKALAKFLGTRFDDDANALTTESLEPLRQELLEIHGIGEETADTIILYAAGHATFIADAYTRRLFGRLGLSPAEPSYAGYRRMFMAILPPEPELYAEYHALIVRHGVEACRSVPLCSKCPLLGICVEGRDVLDGGSPGRAPLRTVP